MRIVECEQYSDEWWYARLGVPTASEFDKIITPAKLEPPKSRYTYRNQLLGEWLRGKADEGFQSEYMKRGSELEQDAAEAYAFMYDIEPQPIGFCIENGGRYGCSPDRAIGENAGLEVKCPSPGVHVGYLLDGKLPTTYRVQLLGQLLVTGWDYIDFMSYHPDMESMVVRVTADDNDEAITKVAKALDKFCDDLDACKLTLFENGYARAA